MKNLFKKKDKGIGKDQAFLDLKDSMKKIDASVKKKEQVIVDLKKKAMVALAQKNEKLAKVHLSKKIKQEKDIEGLYNIQRKLSDQMDAIDQAETIENATKALSNAVGVLNRYAKVIENLNVESIVADSEESMAIIDEAAEAMGDTTEDVLASDQLQQELEEMQAEVALDMGGRLAGTPEGEMPADLVVAEEEANKPSAEDVKKELEKLKRELDM
ncbi:MAG: Snf7 family protein [Candidatus Lokiarchaeota archaeon]|nr:Snf7 family protein [Candidatus Lokiarchaeota archaeon]